MSEFCNYISFILFSCKVKTFHTYNKKYRVKKNKTHVHFIDFVDNVDKVNFDKNISFLSLLQESCM